ncbi:hypothetical protein CSPHI_05135 [Corynebacterium sphenisci DSM 44792]|uniref:DNA-binding protein n=1 Tax=Corynebacterium sphenisci DSM 44792 TaxID=1437874 RepID=A0A1L7CXH9_9CORY|nr:YceD family protein [Corynebacterium sphenisci]APT90520.1 hypothetical protein CSPHI_05135 [Corynebacterium sphenisci DSM 44792]
MSTRRIDPASPFVVDVGPVLREGAAAPFRASAPAPERIGAELIGVPAGAEVLVEGRITPLGGGVLVDAEVRAPLAGTCARCLADLDDRLDIRVSRAFGAGEGFVVDDSGEDQDLEDDAPPLVGDYADLTQAVIDETVLTLPFSPTCADFGGVDCAERDTGVPAPDGVVGEGAPEAVDPRWAALAERFGRDDADAGSDADPAGESAR